MNISCREIKLIETDYKNEKLTLFDCIYVLAVLLVCLNGIHNPFIDCISILLILFLIIISNNQTILALVPIASIFFGYSRVLLSPLGFTLENSTVQAMLYCIILVKLFSLGRALVIKNGYKLIWFLSFYCFISTFLNYSVLRAIALLAEMIVVIEIISGFRKKNDEFNLFTKAYFVCLLGEIVYGINFNESVGPGWRSSQFGGVFDPNNFAIHCCLLVTLVFFISPNCFKKIAKIIVLFICGIGVISSVSFTGCLLFVSLCICIQIFPQNGVFQQNKIFRGLLIGALILVLILFLIINFSHLLEIMLNSNVAGINALGQRLTSMMRLYNNGDLNSFSSGRLNLNQEYYEYFKNSSIMTQLFGDPGNMSNLVGIYGRSSHNSYIDLLLSYGYFGFALFLAIIVSFVYKRIKASEWDRVTISVLFLIIAYSRTLGIDNLLLFGCF